MVLVYHIIWLYQVLIYIHLHPFTSIYIHLHFYMAMDQYLLSTIFSGMNIHFNPAILMWTKGVPMVLTHFYMVPLKCHCHVNFIMISTHHGTSSRRQDAELPTGMELATRDDDADDVDAVDDPGRSRSVSPESLERRNGWFGCWQYMGNIWEIYGKYMGNRVNNG